jgi:hypothetical protein
MNLKAMIVGTTYEGENATPLPPTAWESEDVAVDFFHACHERED